MSVLRRATVIGMLVAALILGGTSAKPSAQIQEHARHAAPHATSSLRQAGVAATSFGIGGMARVSHDSNEETGSMFLVAHRTKEGNVAVEVRLCSMITLEAVPTCHGYQHSGPAELEMDPGSPRLKMDIPDLGMVDLDFRSATINLGGQECVEGESTIAMQSLEGVVDGFMAAGGTVGDWVVDVGLCALWANQAAVQWVAA